MKQKNNANNPAKVGAIVTLMSVPAGLLMGCTPGSNTTTTTTNMNAVGSESSSTMGVYKDGTYEVIGNYTSPGGAETLDVSLTLKNGIITDSTVKMMAERPMSVNFQTMFVNNYKSQVVGKSIDEVKLTKISGSSLAPKGFNDAVAKIKIEAKA